jgi:polyhydroxybutyrate depolymerase
MLWKFLIIGLALGGLAVADAPQAAVRRTIVVDGVSRTYLLYRPADQTDAAKPRPLVVMLHGAFGSGEQAERACHWDAMADRGGFVVVYPDGIGRTWNAGGACCGRAHRDGVNDVGFLDRLIESVVKDEAIDPAHIYMTGMSNGGAMTYRYACEGRTKLAAIGPVASSFTYACLQVPALPVMAFHGLDDRTVPFAGGAGRRGRDLIWQPVETSLALFRAADHCSAPTSNSVAEVTTATAVCDKGLKVVLITVAGAGHQWPGSARESGLFPLLLRLDPPSTSVDATQHLWTFFHSY